MSEEERNQWLSIKFQSFSFIYSLIFNRLSKSELEDYHCLVDFYDQGCIFDIEVNIDDKESTYVSYELLSKIYYELKKKVPEKYRCMIGPMIAHRITIYVSEPSKVEGAFAENRLAVKKLAEEFRQVLIEKGDFNVNIGIGSFRPISELTLSYDEAIQSLRYQYASGICLIEDKHDHARHMEMYSELREKFLASIKYGEENSITYMARLLEQLSMFKLDTQKNMILEIIVLAVKEVYDRDSRQESQVDFLRYASELERMDSTEKLQRWCYRTFHYIMRVLQQRHRNKKSYILKKALLYMEEHYMEEINLRDVSNEIGMTPQYFSTIFKQSMGMNFVEWLSARRIGKAMEYLNEPGAVIKEVCFRVGYNDPNYFSRIFKKVSGMTPKEYMGRNKKDT